MVGQVSLENRSLMQYYKRFYNLSCSNNKKKAMVKLTFQMSKSSVPFSLVLKTALANAQYS